MINSPSSYINSNLGTYNVAAFFSSATDGTYYFGYYNFPNHIGGNVQINDAVVAGIKVMEPSQFSTVLTYPPGCVLFRTTDPVVAGRWVYFGITVT